MPDDFMMISVYRQAEIDALIATVNAAVAASTKKAIDAQTRLSALEPKVPALDTRVRTAEVSLASAVAKVTALEPKVPALDTRVKTLESKPPVDLTPLRERMDAVEAFELRLDNLAARLAVLEGEMTFAEAPVSLGEVRAEKQADSKLWSPRDALINILRDIDGGKAAPADIVICYREKTEDGYASRYLVAGPGGMFVSLGLLARVSFRMQEDD